MTKKLLFAVMVLGALCGAVFYILTMPDRLDAAVLPDRSPDPVNGERMFWAGGCASCHAAPGAKGDAKLLLTGGLGLETPFGTFRAPNISPDPQAGIGGWTTLDFVNAMAKGVSPDGRHYYPAFPYTNYQRMPLEDLIDLKTFLDGLEPSDNRVAGHDLGFPFNISRGLGLWKKLYLDGRRFALDETRGGQLERGRYIVEGPGHCGACHTPRDRFGGEIAARHLAGAAAFEGKAGDKAKAGVIPNITPHADGIGDWSEADIAYALQTGLNPDYDSFGGSMVSVQENMARLPADDRAAIAAYLKSLPALPSDKTLGGKR